MGIGSKIKRFFRKKSNLSNAWISNLYNSCYKKKVLISYLTTPFLNANQFKHQNYLTSHIVAETFSELGYNVDIIDYLNPDLQISYEDYDVIFGIGDNFERSFYHAKRSIPRIHLLTGAHQELHNAMSLKSIEDFYKLSGIWLPKEVNVLPESCYYSMFNADAIIILAHGFVFKDCKSRFRYPLYSLNNNILGIFSSFPVKTIRTKNFLFLSGGRQITKGLPLLLEVAKLRKELNFYVVVPHINHELELHYEEVLRAANVFLFKDIRMDSEEMKDIIQTCSYVLAPSYIDGLPGGTIEPMSAGLIPVVSKYCGFPQESFIFEMEQLSIEHLARMIDKVLELDNSTYFKYSAAVKSYAQEQFSKVKVKEQLSEILRLELLN